jgi:Phospholipase_D-nuclease N-terminal
MVALPRAVRPCVPGAPTAHDDLHGNQAEQGPPALERSATGAEGRRVVTTTIQLGLAAAAWTDLARRPAVQVRGPKWRWALVIAVNYAGPLAYFRWGRARPPRGG